MQLDLEMLTIPQQSFSLIAKKWHLHYEPLTKTTSSVRKSDRKKPETGDYF